MRFLFSHCSRFRRSSSHGLSGPEDARPASPSQCPVPDESGKSTLNAGINVGIAHGNIGNRHGEGKGSDAGCSNQRELADREAKETGLSDGYSDKNDTSGDDSAVRRAPKKVEDEEVPTTDGVAENRCLDDVEGRERTTVDGIAENGTQQGNAENEKTGSGNNVVQNGPQGEDTSDEGGRLISGEVGSGTSEEEGGRQVRSRVPRRSTLRKPSDSGPPAEPKRVTWAESLPEVHEYVRNDSRELWDDEPQTCSCFFL